MKIAKKELIKNLIIFVVSCLVTLVIVLYSFKITIPVFETGILFLMLMSPVFFYYIYINMKTSRKVNKLIEKELSERIKN